MLSNKYLNKCIGMNRLCVCEREIMQVFISISWYVYVLCVVMSLRLRVAGLSRCSQYFPEELRVDVLSVRFRPNLML